jgi:hypothetical protein
MENRMEMVTKKERVWRRKAAETSKWKLATQPRKKAQKPMGSMTFSTQGRLTLSSIYQSLFEV